MANVRDGNWECTLEWDGRLLKASTDDLTLDELEIAEQVSGVPWALMNPVASVRVAKSLFAVLMMRAGMEQDEAMKRCAELHGRDLFGAFTWIEPTDPLPPTEEAAAVPPSSAPTSQAG